MNDIVQPASVLVDVFHEGRYLRAFHRVPAAQSVDIFVRDLAQNAEHVEVERLATLQQRQDAGQVDLVFAKAT